MRARSGAERARRPLRSHNPLAKKWLASFTAMCKTIAICHLEGARIAVILATLAKKVSLPYPLKINIVSLLCRPSHRRGDSHSHTILLQDDPKNLGLVHVYLFDLRLNFWKLPRGVNVGANCPRDDLCKGQLNDKVWGIEKVRTIIHINGTLKST